MKKYNRIFLGIGLFIAMSFYILCIVHAKDYVSSKKRNYNHIHTQQKEIKEKLDRIERKIKKRKNI